MKFALPIAAGFALLLASSMTAHSADSLKAGTFDPPRLAPDFLLQGSNAKPVRISDFRGKVVVLGFGFTSCAAVCPTTLAVLAAARKRLGPSGVDVQIVYVTVDPERDTAEHMKKYLATFDPTIVGATGTEEALAKVRKDYGIQADKKTFGNDYLYAHSSFTLLIDREGRIRALMPYGHSPEDYAHDLRILLGR